MNVRMEEKLLGPTSDMTFKKIFGTEKSILKEFINDTVQQNIVEEIVDITVDRAEPAEIAKSKVCKTDLFCKAVDGKIFLVEMQLNGQSHFVNRVSHYAYEKVSRQLSKGDGYKKLKPLYMIIICNFNVLSDCGWYSRHRCLNESKLIEMIGEPLTLEMIQCNFPHCTFIVIQLLKFNQNLSMESTDLESWMIFLKRAPELTSQERAMIVQRKPIIEEAMKKLVISNYSEEELEQYRASVDWERIVIDAKNEEQELKDRVRRIEEEKCRIEEEKCRIEEEERRIEEENCRIEEENRELKRRLSEMVSQGDIDASKIARLL